MKCIILDDNNKYIIVSKFTINEEKYALFSNVEDYKKTCFRKIKIINDKEFYVGLDNKEEFQKVAEYISKNLK